MGVQVDKFLGWLSGRLPVRIIADEGRLYLERYYLCTAFGVRCYLHRFVGSDPDRGYHDHPWRWALSIILAGWYIEEKRDGAHVRKLLNFLTGDTFHRVVLPENGDVWTLFVHRVGRVKSWGFLRAAGAGWRWTPYSYLHEMAYLDWWLHVPKGRDEPRRKV